MLLQIRHDPVEVFNPVRADANEEDRSSGARRRKNANRDADLGPIPGNRSRAVMRFCIGAGRIAIDD
jgi:hypothetical protein